MVVHYPPDLSGVERKVEEGVKQLKQTQWYQKPWEILILGIVASGIVTIVFYFL